VAKKKSVNFLPEYLKTEKNKKFLASTLDHLIQTPEVERIDGFVGSKLTPNYDPTIDVYIDESQGSKKNYSLEPALTLKNISGEITDIIAFDDLLNELKSYQSNTDNLDKLMRSKFYSYDPYIDWDKLVNYFDYYWLPQGPDSIVIDELGIDVDAEIVGNPTYSLPYQYTDGEGNLINYTLSNGMKLVFGTQVTPSTYRENTYYVEGVGDSIRLIDIRYLENNEGLADVYNETFDSDGLDEYPFDGGKRLPLVPEYITINRASKDYNSWTRYNRWFHKDIIEKTAGINQTPVLFDFNQRAKRPIVEFRPNLKLYNHGTVGLENVDLIDNNTADAFATVNGSYGYYIDGTLIQAGNRLIFNTDPDNKNKIFQVSYTTGTTSTIILTTVTSLTTSSVGVSINFGNTYGGTSWYFDTESDSWKLAQQHTTINQFPLFDVFDNDGVSYSNTATYQSNFLGTRLFGYDVGIGASDTVLGFPLKYQNSSGIGSFLFKNYFMTDSFNIKENNQSSTKLVANTYLKNYETSELFNVWQQETEYHLPIVEIQTVSETTSTLYIKSLDVPIEAASITSIAVYKNDQLLRSAFTASSTASSVTLDNQLDANDTVAIKIFTDQEPNLNGYYEIPLSMVNNPLNGPVKDFTLSELRDHLTTMLDDITDVNYDGTNLRDVVGYTKYGTRIIVNSNPLSFASIFLGKSEHNVVDALRKVGNSYLQFKDNFLRKLLFVSADITHAEAVDQILKEINLTKDFNSAYYRSDMLGYGDNKTVKNYTVTNPAVTDYPIGIDFSLSALSFKSVLVYLNGDQLIYDTDYFINIDEVSFNLSLSVNDEIEILVYSNTLGCFVPPTPTKLGLYPKYEPEIFTDDTYIDQNVDLIRGHDGSLLVAYGDYRDDIILEFEKRIYNNIKVQYQPNIYDVRAGIPGAFRNRSLFRPSQDIVNVDFSFWAGINNVDIKTNTAFDYGNEFTYNYTQSVDKIFAEEVPSYWRGIYNYFFDTDRPHSHPWEMLGFAIKPNWWDTHYEWVDNVKRADLIDAIVQGKVSDPTESDEYNIRYARPNFASINPVDSSGNLVGPLAVVSNNADNVKILGWIYGDGAPSETAWKNSSYWPYAVNIISLLLNPADYLSALFDTSRIALNIKNQVTYTEDDLYLDPRKIILDGENNNQSSGYSIMVIEAGKLKNQNYLQSLRQDLDNLDYNLFYKLGGFTSKEKLQINIDSVDPVSTSPGLVVPYEDYNVFLNVSNPVKIASASGMIIQKQNGKFVLKGYDLEKPYFDVLLPFKEATSPALTVGGISEDFTEWSGITQNKNLKLTASETSTANASPTTRFYREGQIVRYNNRFYRSKVGHNPGSTFDSSLWYSLTTLPLKGGVTVQTSRKFSPTTTRYFYGSEIPTIQEVYDIITGYGKFLEQEGFIFDDYSTDLEQNIDWKYSAKEFLFWCTQNWADGNIITLSPFANAFKYFYDNSIVDDVKTGRFAYNLLKADGKSFPIENFSLIREDSACRIQTKNTEEGIFFVKLVLIQKEHAIVFNNTTVFNDTIYDIETGYKQRRVKLSGFRTKNWNGDFYSPGFVYDNLIITDWSSLKNYTIGDIVRYNGSYYQANKRIEPSTNFDFKKWSLLNEKPVPDLLPNFDYKINQFEDFYSLDIDNFDAGQQKLAQHLIGYTPRTYFNNIFTNPISQYKFYQGFIKDKGTKNAIDKLSKASRYLNKGEVTFTEEWAFRTGYYGGFSNYDEIEFTLPEGTTLENPYLVKFADQVPTDVGPLENYVTPNDLLLTPQDYSSSNVFPVITPESTIVPGGTFLDSPNSPGGTYNETGIILSTAGYVRLDDVTATAYNKNSLLDIAKNNQIQNRSTIWTGFLENGDWSVYRYSKNKAKVTGVYVSAPGANITFSTNLHHNLSVGDIVSIVNFNEQVNGVYIVESVPQLSQFTVQSSLTSIQNQEQLAYGNLFVFESARFTRLSDLRNKKQLFDLDEGELIWVDSGIDNRWQVYEKSNQFPVEYIRSVDSPSAQELGYTIWAADNTDKFLVAVPNFNTTATQSYGRVKVYDRIDQSITKLFEYTLNTYDIQYCNPAKPTEFGYAMAYDVGKNYLIIGAPRASNVKGLSSLEFRPTNVTFSIDILVSNSATVTSSSGEAVGSNAFIASPEEVTWNMTVGVTTSTVYSTAGTFTSATRIFDDEGLVKISSIGPYNDAEVVEAVLTNPLGQYSTSSNKVRFGHSIYINEATTSASTLLIVSAPGTEGVGNQLYVYPTSVTFAMSTGSTASVISSTSTNISTGTTGNVFAYRIRKNNGLQIGAFASGLNVLSTSSVALKVGDQWGYKVSGNSTGTYISVSAPGYKDENSSGLVQIFRFINNGIYHNQTIFSPYGTSGNFGKDQIISYTGKYLVVSAPDYRNLDTSYGSVKVYQLGTNRRYSLLQTIDNPIAGSDLRFGHSLSLNKAETKLLISGLGTNRSIEIKFDENSKSGITTFDGGTTKFKDLIPDSGTVYAYQRLGTYFVPGNEIVDTAIQEGSKYGFDVVSTNKYSYVGAPFNKLSTGTDNSMAFVFDMPEILTVKHQQPDLVDISSIERIALIDSYKEEVSEYLELIDPLKGKISGLAEQEIKYKSPSDPAIYSIGRPGNIVDDKNNWLDDHVGELWWDLSTLKYIWYEQGDDIFRKNNWGKLFPGATIDIYEWVRSDLLPSAWAAQADTNQGTSNGISGQPKYPANDVVSVKQIFNAVTGSFENVYYFWVKNKLLLPDVKNRRLSSYQVANLIADPQANGVKFVQVLSSSSVAFTNVQPLLVDNRISANMSFTYDNPIPRHTEWLLLNEGNQNSVPNALLEKKLFDSLLGEDTSGNPVPDPILSFRNRYGLGIRPQQTLFKDRVEALRNIVVFSNDVLSKEQIVGKYELDTLLLKDEIPSESEGRYDILIDSILELDSIDTSNIRQAVISCTVNNGKIDNVNVIDSGKGYIFAPVVTIKDTNTSAELVSVLDESGKIIRVDITNAGTEYATAPLLEVRPFTAILTSNPDDGGRWTVHEYNNASETWFKVSTQKFRTEDYWDYIDWSASNYNQYKIFSYVVGIPSDIALYNDTTDGTYIKINNNGNGKYVIVEKVSDNGNFTKYFNSVYVQDGTIKILDKVWNDAEAADNYDEAGLADNLYDQSNTIELRNILTALKNDLFVGDLKVNWNLLFFVAVRYALTEQKLLDWAFKTSFVNVVTDLGVLDQRPVYKLDNEQYFEDYIKEIKPYHTKIRNYNSKYNTIEFYDGNITDFDLPTVYDQTLNEYKPITILSTTSATVFTLTNTLTNVYPWKYWTDNYTYYVKEILVADGGQNYTQRPVVELITVNGDYGTGATAEAFIRAGKVYKVIVTNPGSGYVFAPVAQLTGGGAGVIPAALSVVMDNDTIRKNKIGLRFDRISKGVEITDTYVTDKFDCTGEQNSFVLTWLANPDKSTITPTIDGKLVFATDYKLEYYKEDYEGLYTKEFTRLTLLKSVPLAGQTFKVIYKKNIKLFNAVDRIEQYYSPTPGMLADNLTDLVSGLDYPLTTYEGMMFDQTAPWGTTTYDSAPWDDIVSELVTVKLLQDIDTTATTITVNTTTGITTGQSIIIGNTSTIKIRPETIVTEIDSSTNVITISSPVYDLKTVLSTDTSIGSLIEFTTKKQFRGDIKVGDVVLINGIITGGYNGQYVVSTTTNNKFYTTATQVLSSTTTQLSTPATARVLSILSTISSITSVLDKVVQSSTGTSTLQIFTYALYSQIATATVSFSSGSPSWYIASSSGTVQRAIVNISGLNPSVRTTATVTILGNTDIDFWKYNLSPDQLTVNLDGGQYTNGIKTSALGTTATDNIVQGGGWIKPVGQYYGYKLTTNVPGSTASNYADAIDRYYLRYLYRHADQVGLDYWVQTIVDGNNTLESVEANIKVSAESTQINASFNPDGLINPFRSYAPEEFVPGDTKDSLSITVYTRPERISPIMFNGVIYNIAGQETTATLQLVTDEIPAGLIVTFNGKPLSRVDNYPLPFDLDNQVYFLEGNRITIGAQTVGGRIGYSYVTASSDTGLDSQYVYVNSTSTQTATLISDMPFNGVGSVFVQLNGNQQIGPYSVGTGLGYVLEPVGNVNKRAKITVNEIAAGRNEVTAWFFRNRIDTFNRIKETYYNISTSTVSIPLDPVPFNLEPISTQVIVEKLTGNPYSPRTRLLPPDTSYYKITGNQLTFDINNNKSGAAYNNQNVKVYVNGYEIRPGFDFVVNAATETITIIQNVVAFNDVIAIMDLTDYDYVIINRILYLKNAVTSGAIKVTSFTDHDGMGLRTERFDRTHNNEYTLDMPVINENYIWVTANDKALIAGYDFYVKPDLQTIVIGNDVPMTTGSKVVIVSVNPANYDNTVIAYRLFKDIFDRQSFRRVSNFFSTKLAHPLNYYDDSIHVEDGSMLFSPNPSKNIPGVVFIDGERIEYFVKNGNELTQLRRGTFGTGTPWYSAEGTLVFDQSVKQNVYTEETVNIQNIPTTYLTLYNISTVTNTSSFSINTTTHAGSGISLLTTSTHGYVPAYVDQVDVYYGGRKLRKTELKLHYNERAYDTTSSVYYNNETTSSYDVLPPEYTIEVDTSQTLLLNISEEIVPGTQITVIQRKGRVWDISTASILVSTSTQAKFLRKGPAQLPSSYYYGGNLELTDETNAPLTEDDGDLLQGL